MSNGDLVLPEYIVYGYMVKYEKLAELVGSAFRDSNATSINVYIDLFGIYRTVMSEHYRTDIQDYTSLTSTILNMCGHYRQFFKRSGVHTKIFLISSFNINEVNRKFVAGYNDDFMRKLGSKSICDMVSLNCDLLELICPYLFDIYFLRSEYESSSVIDYLISKGDQNPNLIISKDIYPCQLTYLHPLTAYIKPKKIKNEDISVVIPPYQNIEYNEAFWEVYTKTRGSQNMILRSSITIDPINFTLLAALTKFPERGLKSLLPVRSANKLIYDVVGTDRTKISTVSIMEGLNTRSNVSSITVDNRHKALDVEYFRYVYWDTPEANMIKFQNLDDNGVLRSICSEYFVKTPVDLSRL